MQCSVCGSNLVRGFTFCLECGNPVPHEMLEESGLPQRDNLDRGPQEISVPETAMPVGNTQQDEEVGDLRPKLIGGDVDQGEALKPQLMGGDTYDKGKALKPKLMGVGDEEAGEALKPKLIGGEEQTGVGTKVKATMQNSSDDVNDNGVEKLMFCPNCGMHMQRDPVKCEICGMTLGNVPNNVPKSASGIPLFNTDPDPFSGTGGIGGFGGFGGVSDEDVSRIDNFVNNGGNPNPMFNSGSSAFNVQSSPSDLAQLTQQLANFSAGADMPNIGVTENTKIRQQAVPKGKDVKLSDFSMTDDLQSESVPISDSSVPVVGDYSMEDNPDEYINLDPFAFVGMSMDEEPQYPSVSAEPMPSTAPIEPEPVSEPSLEPIAAPIPVNDPEPEPVSVPEPKPVSTPRPAPVAEPVKPPSFFGEEPDDIPEETAPFIAEESPVISEASLPEPITVKKSAPPAATQNAAPRAAVTGPAPIAEQPTVRRQAAMPEQPDAPLRPPAAPKTKICYACGKNMPVKDKFCPNCGRSTFGLPNPNIAPPPSQTAKKKRNYKPFYAIALVVIILAVVIGFLIFNANASEIDFDTLTQTVFNAEQEFSATASQYIIS